MIFTMVCIENLWHICAIGITVEMEELLCEVFCVAPWTTVDLSCESCDEKGIVCEKILALIVFMRKQGIRLEEQELE